MKTWIVASVAALGLFMGALAQDPLDAVFPGKDVSGLDLAHTPGIVGHNSARGKAS